MQVYPDGSWNVPCQDAHVCRGGQFHALGCRSCCQDVQGRPDLPGALLAGCQQAVEQVIVEEFHVFVVSYAGPLLDARQVQKLVEPALLLERKSFLECCDCGSPVPRWCSPGYPGRER